MADHIDLAKAYVTIVPTTTGIQSTLTSALTGSSGAAGTAAGNSFGNKFASALGTAGKVAGAALTASTAAAGAFVASSIRAGASFDSAMSQVAATAGMTVDELNETIGSADTSFGHFEGTMSEFAQYMGANTAFSATQAAEALNYMALAGYKTQESMDMLPNVLSLAAAGSMDLARASDMVTDTQTAFGISFERTSQMVDEMAKAASTGNTSVEQLGDAFLTVGGLAQELNGGFVELADGTLQEVDGVQELEIALTAMANAGIKGSEAGTHMRNMILKLTDPTNDGAAALEAMGVAVFDAEGNMNSLSDIMNGLSLAMEDMTQEEKLSAISDLFNTRDTAAAEALLNAMSSDWDEIGQSILEADGAAAQMADTQLDNLSGDVTIFRSALEGAQIAISDSLSPTLREFVQLGTTGLQSVTAGFEEGGLDGAMDALGTWLSDAISMIVEMAPDLIEAGIELLGALGQGLIDNAPQIMDAVIEVLQTLVDSFNESVNGDGVSQFVETTMLIIQKLGEFLILNLPTIMGTITELISQLITFFTSPENQVMMMDLSLQLILAIADGLVQAIPNLVSVIPQVIAANIQAAKETFPMVLEAIGLLIGDLALMVLGLVGGLMGDSYEEVMSSLEEVWDYVSQSFDDAISGLGEWIGNIGENISALWEDIKEWFSGGVETVMETFDGWWDSISEWFGDLADNALTWAGDMIDNFVSGITGGIGRVGEAVGGIADSIRSLIGFSEPEKGPLSNFHTFAPDMIDLFSEGIEDSTPELEATLNRTLSLPILSSPGAIASYEPSVDGVGVSGNGDMIIPIYIGQEKLDTIMIRAEQMNTYRRGG